MTKILTTIQPTKLSLPTISRLLKVRKPFEGCQTGFSNPKKEKPRNSLIHKSDLSFLIVRGSNNNQWTALEEWTGLEEWTLQTTKGLQLKKKMKGGKDMTLYKLISSQLHKFISNPVFSPKERSIRKGLHLNLRKKLMSTMKRREKNLMCLGKKENKKSMFLPWWELSRSAN